MLNDRGYPPSNDEITIDILQEQNRLLRKIERALGYIALGVAVIAGTLLGMRLGW